MLGKNTGKKFLGSKNKYCQMTKNIGALLAQILNLHACATLKFTGDLI
jgi:hypothetical protein